jgi:hypothetical protein
MRTFPAILTGLILAWLATHVPAAGDDDPLTAVRKAETEFHAAGDKWEAVAAKGGDTAAVQGQIAKAYGSVLSAVRKTDLTPNAAYLVPDPLVQAGQLRLPDKTEWSYLVGKGQRGLIVSVWKRTTWADQLPPHGLAASIGVAPPELLTKFTVAKANWADVDKKVLRVPYTIGDTKGVVEIRRDGARWTIHPDRGEMEKGDWWRPFPKE